ncbi:ABC transporter permease [Angustibacter sp. McL0619]|uniref:ABC transporter permease n=1 Tax=Angustibacter sp. McL0619 TaxID=3415676 RepID=UPI003CE6FEEB
MSPADVPGRATLRLLNSELGLLLGRMRIRAGLAVLAAVPVLIAVVVRTFGGPSNPGEGPPFLSDVTQNGLFIAFTALTVELPLFLPLAVGVVAGDSIAGEAQMGTLRYLLVAPAGRTRLAVVKLASAILFCLVATFVVAVAGWLVGAALFPLHDVALLSGGTISAGDAIVRGAAVAGYVGLSLAGLSAVGVFVSTLTDVPIAAMATTVGLAITSQILDVIPQVSAIHPWLPTHYWLAFGDLLRQPVDTSMMVHGLLLQLGYVLVFGAAAWARFTTRDVL